MHSFMPTDDSVDSAMTDVYNMTADHYLASAMTADHKEGSEFSDSVMIAEHNIDRILI